MSTIVTTLGRMPGMSESGRVAARLGTAVNGLLDRWVAEPALVCGDADSSLLAIGRDLATEGRLLYQPRPR